MFEGKVRQDYTFRAHIAATGQDRHLDPGIGLAYFYDKEGSCVLGFDTRELGLIVAAQLGTLQMRMQRTNKIAVSHGLSNSHTVLREHVKNFELDSPLFKFGLKQIIKDEYQKWAFLVTSPKMKIQFLQLMRRGDTCSAIMNIVNTPYVFSMQEIHILQQLEKGSTLTKAARTLNRKRATLDSHLLRLAARNEIYLHSVKAGRFICDKVRPLGLLSDDTVAQIEQRVIDLHRETSTLPAQMGTGGEHV